MFSKLLKEPTNGSNSQEQKEEIIKELEENK
jgi:hypothetical protein